MHIVPTSFRDHPKKGSAELLGGAAETRLARGLRECDEVMACHHLFTSILAADLSRRAVDGAIILLT